MTARHHEAGLGQVLFQSSLLSFQLGDPLLLPVTLGPARGWVNPAGQVASVIAGGVLLALMGDG